MDTTHWQPDPVTPDDLWRGTGLYDEFLALQHVSGRYLLYFWTGEGYETIGEYMTPEAVDAAAFDVLKTTHT